MIDRSTERLVFFTDAVTAIAMTVLALELPLPSKGTNAEMWRSFGSHWHDSYLPFLLSFLVIAAFWWVHHEMFRRISTLGPGLTRLNMLFLLMIVLVPFATRMLGFDGGRQIGTVFYAAVVATISLTLVSMAELAIRRGWLADPAEIRTQRVVSRNLVGNAIVFLLSIPISFFWGPSAATYSWFALFVVSFVVNRLVSVGRRRSEKVADQT